MFVVSYRCLWLGVAATLCACAGAPPSVRPVDQPRLLSRGGEPVLVTPRDDLRRIDMDSTPRWFPSYRDPRVQSAQAVRTEFSATWRIIFDDAALDSEATKSRLIRILEKDARYYVVTFEAALPQDLEKLSDVWLGEIRGMILASGIPAMKLLMASHKMLPEGSGLTSRIVVEAIR